MTDHDPAFLWETEAIRSAPPRVAEAELDIGDPPHAEGQWVTLREASRATGIPVETLRKWARRATIPTYLTPAPGGVNLRMVDLDGISRRATELGRPIEPETAVDTPAGDRAAVGEAHPAEPSETVEPAPPQPPPGTMIVPVDAWNKMLGQLGNLHEAGQQLAEARERAAKAETEAKFLRERLAELRREPEPPPAPPPEPTHTADPQPTPVIIDPVAKPPEKVWHYLLRRVRDRNLG